ncbi:DUF559 domain-containing protein [Pseudactinotalea sp.]|uniref:DUF559 domain-containing protein n=1 Tax=Pseudactinotalea sp. TaxID=1926260 RepID=UPI003B3B8577
MDLTELTRATTATMGVFTLDMAADIGITAADVGRLRRSGSISRVCGDGHVVGLGPVSVEQRAIATCLTWPDAIVCFRTAALIHGLPTVADDGFTYALVPAGRRTRHGLVPRFWSVRPTEVERTEHWRVTDRVTTMLDCLGRLPADEAWGLLAWLVTRDLVTADELDSQTHERKGLYGIVRLRAMIAAVRRGAVSPAEIKLQDFLVAHGFTGWVGDKKIYRGRRIVARADILFVGERVILEYDGRLAHPDPSAPDEIARDELLRDLGYAVVHVTWERILHEPWALAEEIRTALESRSGVVSSVKSGM